MPSSEQENNKRITKNTLFLYFRTLLIMAVSLYTSRVVLDVLGVEDYGIYNVVGGAVALFGVVSGALSNAISRFITFELGKGDYKKLAKVFSTSVNIQVGISLVILLVCEIIGIYFLNNLLNIPADRVTIAFWVLQCSILTFCVNLISVPYNACIIAHEHMKAFAYVSVFEALAKLGICFLIIKSPFDKLFCYAVLLVVVALVVRIIYGLYCRKHFSESIYHFEMDKSLVKEIWSFASWTFLTNGVYIFNTQGVNVLINNFFGVTFNAARGIAIQIEGAIMQFVNNFGTAINPQITKNYAAGKMEEMYKLVCRGARFSHLLLLFFSLPFLFETDFVLHFWLKVVPDNTAIFFKLGIIGTMVTMLGNTGVTACMATGNIRKYVLYLSIVGSLVFPITFVCFKLGLAVYVSYVVYIGVYLMVFLVRLWIMKGLLNFPILMFIKNVCCRVILVTIVAIIPPLYIVENFETSIGRFLFTSIVCICSASLGSLLFGVTKHEREIIILGIKNKLKRICV